MRPAHFRQQIARPSGPPPVETHPWYWNPNRIGAIQAPSWFMERIEEIDPNLDVRYNPVTSKWGVWVRNPRLVHPLCQGWKLLFIHHDQSGRPMPLDERLLGRLHLIDMKNSSAKAYFDRVVSEMEREKQAREKSMAQDTMDLAIERGWDHSRIQVSMRGHSDGSKFSKFHA